MSEEVNILEYWDVIVREKAWVLSLCLGAAVVTLALSLWLPDYYLAETTIISQSSESRELGTALSSLPLAGALMGTAGIQSPGDRIMVILRSRTVSESVIRKFGLLRLFNERKWDSARDAWKDPGRPPTMASAVKRLTRRVAKFRKSKEGAITVQVEWKDPRIAAEIANYYVSALTQILNEKSINITVQTLDRAVPAEEKSRPLIMLNVSVAALFGLIAGIMAAFLTDYLARLRALSAGRSVVPSEAGGQGRGELPESAIPALFQDKNR